MHELNPPQLEAVRTLVGPLLVLAGAGTGKTRVVTCRIAELIRSGIPPARILAVTFINKAAAEMQQRAAALLGKRLPQKPEISTFHSLCVRILRRHARRLGYPPQFAIYDRGDQEGLARRVLREIHVPGETLRPGDLVATIGRWKTRGVRPEQAASHARTDRDHLAAVAFRRYQQSLKAAGAVDFDDLLLLVEELLAKFADVREAEKARFSHLLVDEYQDTSASQYSIVKALAGGHRNLCVVGDDDQSIYGWRGAEVAHILRFHSDWPDARVVRLEQNYRSTEAILTLANQLIVFNRSRHPKVLRPARLGGEKPRIMQCQDETDEAQTVVEDIRSRLAGGELAPRDFAILFRTNEQPRPFEVELRRAKIPYVLIGGMSFYDRKEVRDLLAYLKLIACPTDEVSLLRVINTPARGIGPKVVSALLSQAVTDGNALWERLARTGEVEGMTAAAASSVSGFRALIERYRARAAKGPLVDVVRSLVDEIGYKAEIVRAFREPIEQQARWAAVEEVINALGAYEKRAGRGAKLAAFLDDIAVGDRMGDTDKDTKLARDAVALMTLHSAKGLEFPHVYLVGMEDGLLPHRRAIELEGTAVDEERRLCYVGITRAQDRLTISLALARQKWGKLRPTTPSRFLFELIGQADRPTRPKPARAPAGSAPKPSAAARPKPRAPR